MKILPKNINLFIDNLPVITVDVVRKLLNNYNISLLNISKFLEVEKLSMIEDTDEWVNIYNSQDAFLSIDILERIVKGNKF